MKKSFLKFIGAGVIINVVGFLIGMLYLWGKLYLIQGITSINPFSVVARALPKIAIINATYFVVDWFILIVLCGIEVYVLYKCMIRKNRVSGIIIGIVVCIIGAIYVICGNRKPLTSSTAKEGLAILLLMMSYIYIWTYTTAIYNKNIINLRIIEVNKQYRYYLSKYEIKKFNDSYGTYDNENNGLQEAISRKVDDCGDKIIQLVVDKVDYKDKERIEIIREILEIVSKWLKLSSKRITDDSYFRDGEQAITVINKQIQAINTGMYFKSKEELKEISKSLQMEYKKCKDKEMDEKLKIKKRHVKKRMGQYMSYTGNYIACIILIVSSYLITIFWIINKTKKFMQGIVIGSTVGIGLILVIISCLYIVKTIYRGSKEIIRFICKSEVAELVKEMLNQDDEEQINIGNVIGKRVYYAINNRAVNYIIVSMIFGALVYVLGMTQSGIDVLDDNNSLNLPRIIFKDNTSVPAIIINNDENHIVYYDGKTGTIKEVEKVNGMYKIECIEYNEKKD